MSKAKVRTGIVGASFAASLHYDGARCVTSVDVEMVDVHAKTRASIEPMLAAEAASKAIILHGVNWVHAPAIQKEREILEKTKGQILWMHGKEAHSGSHAPSYGYWP